jgi:hydroxymethylpyrimidine pyrophosphatase-like HAD family hydrolase
MMVIPNLLLIAGTGTKSGKTSMACKIIEQFPELEITAIKISPHFHETTKGLISKSEKMGFSIYEETNKDTSKDTSRMLNSGANKVFFAKVWDDKLLDVFNEIMEFIPSDVPIICESPALRNFIEPGVFIIMTSNVVNKQKNINHLQELPHAMFTLEELERIGSLPIGFEGGKWFYEVGSPESEVRS